MFSDFEFNINCCRLWYQNSCSCIFSEGDTQSKQKLKTDGMEYVSAFLNSFQKKFEFEFLDPVPNYFFLKI